jgi:hypothetical protein
MRDQGGNDVLHALARKIRTATRLDRGAIHLKSIDWVQPFDHARLLLQIGKSSRAETWRMDVTGVLDAKIEFAPTELFMVTRKHILIDSLVGPFADLRFRGVVNGLGALLADLWETHDRVAETWLSIEDCFEGREQLPTLLASGKGFATGPKRLIASYASVFRKHGLGVALSVLHPGKPYRYGSRWQARRPRVSVCVFGGSYLVGSDFKAEPFVGG